MARRAVRAGAVYDMVVAAPFAVPVLWRMHMEMLHAINQALGDTLQMADFGDAEALFVNMFGIAILVWVAARFRNPGVCTAWYDMWIRIGVSAVFFSNIAAGFAPTILVLLLVVEVAWACVDYWAWRSLSAPASLEPAIETVS